MKQYIVVQSQFHITKSTKSQMFFLIVLTTKENNIKIYSTKNRLFCLYANNVLGSKSPADMGSTESRDIFILGGIYESSNFC